MCGAEHAACGTPSDSVPVDQSVEVAVVGGPLKKYSVVMPSGVTTVMKLNADDATRHGLTDADLVAATSLRGARAARAAHAEAAVTEPEYEEEPKDPEPEEKASSAAPAKVRTTSSNKARTPRGAGTKSGAGGSD